jgi:hypothetical protein
MAFTLPRLSPNVVSPEFQVWWQQVVEAIEAEENTQNQLIIDILEALVSIDDVATVNIAADYTGVVTPSNQLPKNIQFTMREGATDVTALAAWSVATDSGSISCSIGAATGLLTTTALGSTSVITITGVYQGITKTRKQQWNLNLGPVPPTPSGGGGGSSDSTSTFADINSASHAVIATLTADAGSGGVVSLAAPLGVTTAALAPAVTAKVYGKWQWDSTGGGVWVDLAAEVSSSPDCRVTFHTGGGGYYTESDGTLSAPDSKTGLVVGSTHNFRLMARNNSGTRVMSFYGTASAVGS